MSLIESGVSRFVAAEVEPLGLTNLSASTSRTPAMIGGIGTTAAKAVRGVLLADAIAAAGYVVGSATAFGSPEELIKEPSWELGVVLSPWKRAVASYCDRLSASAQLTGVVDTVVRCDSGTVGFNTNTWAATSALEVLLGGASPDAMLILGSGGSARSVTLATQRRWPRCRIVIAARAPAAAEELAESFHVEAAAQEITGQFDVIVNTTTWGETEASEAEPFGVDLTSVLRAGVRLFELNNRIGALPVEALGLGCVVLGGGVMQRVTNASRAALLAYAQSADASTSGTVDNALA